MSEWISVKDRLPKENIDTLLICIKSENKGCFVDTDAFYVDDGYFRFWGVQADSSITHWMPLPEPPEDDE